MRTAFLVERQCVLCGRKGTRSFVTVNTFRNPRGFDERIGVMCKAPRACNRRRGVRR